jgi:ornithine lipid ester-linked acyl 2-hydroxylase
MNTSLVSATAAPSPQPLQRTGDFAHRAHTLQQVRGFARLSRVLSDGIEALVVRVSRLPDQPVYATASFPWTELFAQHWRAVRAELEAVLRQRDALPSFQDILPAVGSITRDEGWKTYWLESIGMDCSDNKRQCPRTTALLKSVPGLRTAFFSILAPGKHIPAHRGAYNGVLRYHLGLIVPAPAERCRIRIANEIHHWREGEALIFDDTFQHEVWNDTDGWRVVLFVDFARPLRQPWHWLNARLLDLGQLAPFLREAARRQKRWARGFHSNQKPEA